MVPSITQVVFVTSPKALSGPQLPTSMACMWSFGQDKNEAHLCLALRFLSCFYFGGGHASLFFSMLFDWEHIFSILFDWSTYFFVCFLSIYSFFSMTALSFRKITRRKISLDLGVFIFGGWMACFA
jgi:hypothetical protein